MAKIFLDDIMVLVQILPIKGTSKEEWKKPLGLTYSQINKQVC